MRSFYFVLSLLAIVTAGCASQTLSSHVNSSTAPDRPLASGECVLIVISNAVSVFELRRVVDSNGSIALPLVESQQIGGLTLSKAAALIERRYSVLESDPSIRVRRCREANGPGTNAPPQEQKNAWFTHSIIQNLLAMNELEEANVDAARALLSQEIIENTHLLLNEVGYDKDAKVLVSYPGLRAAARYWRGKRLDYHDADIAKLLKQKLDLIAEEMESSATDQVKP